jgi:hypothetical protein
MNSTRNKYYCFTKDYLYLFTSLQRYFNFILKKELNILSQTELLTSTDTVLVYQEERENSELLKVFTDNKVLKIVVGLDNNSFMNLIDLSHLKNNLLQAINKSGSRPSKIFTEAELKNKINYFFKGHGEESIFQVLNAVMYCFQNYDFYKAGGLTDEEYKNLFIQPCKMQWAKFLIRFNKYKVYLRLLGHDKEIIKIEEYCVILDEFVKNSDKLIMMKQAKGDTNLAKVQKTLGLLKNIDYFFTKISNKLGLMDAPLQDSGS